MKYTSKKLPNSIVEVEANLDHKEFLDYYQPIYDQALSVVHLKGFRPGTAPKDLADKALDKEKIFHDAVAKAAQSSLKEINEDNNWQLIDQPKIEVLENDPVNNKGLKFKATLTVFPEVKLSDYKKIAKKIIKENTKEISVSEKEIEDSIKWVLNSRSKLVRANKSAEKGDVLDIDFAGFADGPVRDTARAGAPEGPMGRAVSNGMDGLSGKDRFALGEGKFIPGFEENLLGHKEGDAVEFTVTFPNDYWKEDMRAKKVDFKVNIRGVFNRELPELTDEFVKTLGKFENVSDLKKNVSEGMAKEKEHKEKERVRLKIIDQIIKDSKIELPEIMVSRTLDGMVAEFQAYSGMAKTLNPKKEDEDKIRKGFEERAKNSVASNLIFYQIAKDGHLEPKPEEVEAEASQFLKTNASLKDKNIDPQRIYDYSYGIVQNRKVFEYLESLK